MGLAGTRLSIAKRRTAKALDAHLNDALDARIVQYVLLRGARLEDHIVREHPHAVAIVGALGARVIALDLFKEWVYVTYELNGSLPAWHLQ